ncbi:hypothetical protein SAMN05444287_1766 [Octadecabacter temperatus]|uniref:Uncharacterized protein n=1 Tax=Octadecabacter temperatus TaxID=1458307 RepID=A0A0K0Y6Q5_9RHOB|nr:hypothetical protein [Octadecabacter temperatus]AKS46649.1 hypothetical protein OSB_21100 [Octadecabacter temperatus]SIO18533.1 hypothetical protein SAMN05444287_1766 [Octadecabacter temperatus]
MSTTKPIDDAPKVVEYRIFNLPGHGRVRAPVTMTEESLIAALHADDPTVAFK